MRLIGAAVFAVGYVLAIPQAARAQAPTQDTARPPVNRPTTSPEKMQEARERFRRGLQLSEEKNFGAARVELERAYALAPTWKLLYNIGRCYAELGDYVEAIKDLEQYLAEGGEEISTDRRDEVTKDLSELRPRIASVHIKTNVPNADLALDDQSIGRVTDSVVMVNPGRRKFAVSKEGYVTGTQTVTVAGSDDIEVSIPLQATPKAVVATSTDLKPVIAWTVTGAFAVGAAVTGYLALKASNDREDARNARDTDTSRIQSALDKEKTFGLVADILSIGAVLSAGTATYFTFFNKPSKDSTAPASSDNATASVRVKVNAGPGSVFLSGQF